MNAQRNLGGTQSALDSSLSRLSSGFRITRAGDDAAGLGISTKLESQIRSYTQATRNANDGVSLVQATESALHEQASILTRLRELAMQSASDGIGDTERGYVDREAQRLLGELERIAQVTEYNGTKLLDGSNVSGLDFHVGIGQGANDVITLKSVKATTAAASAGTPAAVPAAFSASARLAASGTAFNANMLTLGQSTNASQTVAEASLSAAGATPTEAGYFSWATTYIFDTGYRVAGGTPGQEAIVGAPNAFEQAGLDLVTATQGGGAGSGTGSALLASAFQAFSSALVAANGNVFLARFQTATALGGGSAASSASYAAESLFLAHYAAATGGAPPPFPVALGAAGTAAGLAALGSSYQPAVPTAGGLAVAGLSLASKGSARAALATVDSALATLSSTRAELGATGNRLQSAIANIQAFSESLSAANSRIKDVDVAEETSRMARSQILSQAGVSVLAQANQLPQLALKLLG